MCPVGSWMRRLVRLNIGPWFAWHGMMVSTIAYQRRVAEMISIVSSGYRNGLRNAVLSIDKGVGGIVEPARSFRSKRHEPDFRKISSMSISPSHHRH